LGAQPYERFQDLVRSTDVDVVAILLPHRLHYPVALDALENGKHVTLEKPMAVTYDECCRLMEVAQRGSLKLEVAENTRFVDAYLEVERLVRDGGLGDLRLLRGFISGSAMDEYLSEDPKDDWKKQQHGAGAIIDAAPHFFYFLKWFYGEAKSIQAIGHEFVGGMEVEDHGLVSGEMKNGGFYSVEVSLTAEIPWGERLEIYGSEGSVIVDQLVDPPGRHYRGGLDFEGVPLSVPYMLADWKSKSIAAAVDDFIDAVREDRPPAVRAEDAAYAVLMVERAYQSLQQGSKTIPL
jgi:predicted dehydrogenase